jgi:hypothetical protein
MDLEQTVAKLVELETVARTLKNQNFADIVLSARGRLSQLTEHPDIDTVQRHLSGEPEQGGGRLKELLDRAHNSLKEAREAVDHAPKAEPDKPLPGFELPQVSASGLPDGHLHRNAAGKLFEAHNGTWIPAEIEKTSSPYPNAEVKHGNAILRS